MEKAVSQKSVKRNTRGAVRFLSERLKKHVPALCALSVTMSLSAVLGVSVSIFMARAIDGATSGDHRRMYIYLAVLAAVTLSGIALGFVSQYLQARMAFRMEMSLRRSLLLKILDRDYQAVSSYHSGDLLNRLTNDAAVISSAASSLIPRICQMLARLVFAFGLLAYFDWIFAAVAVGCAVFVAVVSVIARPLIKKLHRRAQEAEGKTRAFMQETIENQLVVRVFDSDGRIAEKTDELQRTTFRVFMKKRLVSILAGEGMSFVFSLGFMLALFWGALSISGVLGPERIISYGTLIAVVQLVGQVQTPFAGLAGVVPQFFTMTASCERLMEVEELPAEAGSEDASRPGEFLSAVFEGIGFSYTKDGSEVSVFKGADCRIEKGDFVAVTGISGIGKSTLLKLLLGVYRPSSGSVTVNTELGPIKAGAAPRRLFAYVPQGNMLLSGTVRENIAFWSRDAGDEEILKAAAVACADEFIEKLPQGLDTKIGEQGHGLSEGQAQRLAVARAILAKAPVLLLDEATSALDAETERRLLKNLKGSDVGTVIIITHKTAALDVCSKELRIVGGRIEMNELSHTRA